MKNRRITLQALSALVKSPTSGTKQFLWDLQVRGFGAYKTAAGRVSFVFQYKMPGGVAKRMKIGELGEFTIDQARDFASDLAYDRRRGIDPVAKRKAERAETKASTELLLSNYAAAFLKRRADGGNPLAKGVEAYIRNDIVKHLGHLRIDQMKLEDIERFVQLMSQRSYSAKRWCVVYLKAILNDAVYREKIVRSPARSIETPQGGERSRVLREDEMVRFLEAANDLGSVRGAILEILLRLGRRVSEVTDMTWEEIDLAKWLWTFGGTRTKNREIQSVILPLAVVQILERHQPNPALRRGRVFTTDDNLPVRLSAQVKVRLDGHLQRRLELANERDGTAFGISHFTLHDLRTAIATTLQQKPFQITTAVIDALLAHTVGGKVTRTYQRSKLVDEVADALNMWNDHLDRLMRGPAAWPGGKDLPSLTKEEAEARCALLRADWTSSQKKMKKKADKEGSEPA